MNWSSGVGVDNDRAIPRKGNANNLAALEQLHETFP
jgi:hypothetical protein